MNRVQGDYFETLLYKIFVTIDGQTTVKEVHLSLVFYLKDRGFQLSEIIDIDEVLVKNAVSVFCRLGFVKKRVTGLEGTPLHTSWLIDSPLNKSESFSSSPTTSIQSPGSDGTIIIATEAVDLSGS